MYKLIKMCLVVLILVSISFSASNRRGFGIGAVIGEPTGISMKNWISSTKAVDGGIAWFANKKLGVHVDYLMHNFNLVKVDQGLLPIYYGIGAKMVIDNDISVGVRLPVGMNYLFSSSQVDIFLELVPVLELVPNSAFNMMGGVGARFFF